MLPFLSEVIVLEEKHGIKTDLSDIGKTNVSSLNRRSTENALLYHTLRGYKILLIIVVSPLLNLFVGNYLLFRFLILKDVLDVQRWVVMKH